MFINLTFFLVRADMKDQVLKLPKLYRKRRVLMFRQNVLKAFTFLGYPGSEVIQTIALLVELDKHHLIYNFISAGDQMLFSLTVSSYSFRCVARAALCCGRAHDSAAVKG